MMESSTNLIHLLRGGHVDESLAEICGPENIVAEKKRWLQIVTLLEKRQDMERAILVNVPGRTELGGNHTDHQRGCVLAAAVDLDLVAAIVPVEAAEISFFFEESLPELRVDLTDMTPLPAEFGSAEGLIRGVAAAFYKRTGHRRGFVAQLHSTCRPGTGLSSSAAFSVLVGAALNGLYHDNALDAETLARMAQEAENDYFGKPCGLMDQMACSLGGIVFIDFEDPLHPAARQLEGRLDDTGYRLAVIDTGGSHVALTGEYAAVPREMQAAAKVFHRTYCRGISREEALARLPEVRQQAGDRAALRLLHFINENERAQQMADALQSGQFDRYLHCVAASQRSSATLLQNCTARDDTDHQGVLLALALSQEFCPRAVCRVHGGGFAGTVQAYVPEAEFKQYSNSMEAVFGAGSVIPIRVGRPGVSVISTAGWVYGKRNKSSCVK